MDRVFEHYPDGALGARDLCGLVCRVLEQGAPSFPCLEWLLDRMEPRR